MSSYSIVDKGVFHAVFTVSLGRHVAVLANMCCMLNHQNIYAAFMHCKQVVHAVFTVQMYIASCIYLLRNFSQHIHRRQGWA